MTKETTHVKLRTRVLAAASTLAVAGGLVAVMAPAAYAAPTVLESCQANLLNTVTPPLGVSDVSTVIKGSDKTPEACTGALSGTTGGTIGNSVGLTGVLSCPGLAGGDPNVYPANGKMSIKYANTDPNNDGKNYSSSAYVRLGSSESGPDVLHVAGIVTKGSAVGADVTGDVGFSGWWDSKFTPAWDVNTTYAKSALVAGSDSKQYKSLAAGNTGNDPTTTPGSWARVYSSPLWTAATTYAVDALVTASDGQIYKSRVNGNVNHNPPTSPIFWQFVSKGNSGPIGFNDLLGCLSGAPGDVIPYAKAFTQGTTTALGTAVNSAITLQFP